MAEKKQKITTKSILVVCVDRDNDLGRKAGTKGPVLGRNSNLNAAAKLAVADPGESDANAIFGAVKKFDQISKIYTQVEVATLTGYGKDGFRSDNEVNRQLDDVLEKFPADAFVLVSDGAEDDQIIPVLQSRKPVISKEVIYVKQAKEVESTYYTIKEALKDPFVSRIVFGVPGILLLLFFALGTWSFQLISLVFGAYLLLKGFGIEEKFLGLFRELSSTISIQRLSFPFYLGSLFILVFGLISGYSKFVSTMEPDLLIRSVQAAQATFLFFVLTALSFIIGRSIDAVHLKKAFHLRKYFLSAVSVLLVWFILDSGTQVITRQYDLNFFLLSMLFSFIVLLAAYRISGVFDVRKRITRLLVGLPVYSAEGAWMGKVENISKAGKSIEYRDNKTKETVRLARKNFRLRKGRVLLT